MMLVLLFCLPRVGLADDGSNLWLRWVKTTTPARVTANHDSDTMKIAVEEVQAYWTGGSVDLNIVEDREDIGPEGFVITGVPRERVTVESRTDAGILYGVYHLIRLCAIQELPSTLSVTENPKYERRLQNHWDSLDGAVTRGYAGHSIWKWDELPGKVSPRYSAYGRACASVGLNGACLTNVNAQPKVLQTAMLQKVKVVADVLRPYKVRVYLAINFASPARIGGLSTSDPLNANVRKWWSDKATEIYNLIPDFGGFLVKASSEGEAGPGDYGRTHVDGANCLAEALAPHGGVVLWRAFVYSSRDNDRAKQAYQEFMPYDGKFASNVVIQVKNGPIDFQPREPFSPLFGGLQKTAVAVEFQITQEYLGQANGIAFLPVLQKEVLVSDTYAKGEGSTVGKCTDGTLFKHATSVISGVSNIGEDANWCGHLFGQANWYGFGRLAWNYDLTPSDIAREWVKQTFTTDSTFVGPVVDILLRSREATVDYMMPLGLHHIMGAANHYGPGPWCTSAGGATVQPDSMCANINTLGPYYHKADSTGIGFERSSKGSNAVSQYFSPLREQFNNVGTTDEKLLLWFHHVGWNYKMKNGRTLWQDLCYHYQHGVDEVRDFQKMWDRLEKYVDAQRFEHVQRKLRLQVRDALWWKDACTQYFKTFPKSPIPYELERPFSNLDDLQKIKLEFTDHN
jgi:alpha-glucuronidase